MTGQSLTESLRETVALFDRPGVPLTTPEVADRLDLGRRSTYDRLDRLVERDRLETKKVGANARVWWRPSAGEEDGNPADGATDGLDAKGGREDDRRRRADREFGARVLETVPASVLVVDAAGEVTTANGRARRRLGPTDDAGEVSLDDLEMYDESGAYVPPGERPYRTVVETGDTVSDWRCRVELPSGERRWLSLRAAPVGEYVERVGDEAARAVVVARDVTRLQEQERQLARRRDELEHELAEVFDRVDDAFFALDDEGRFTHVNERAATLLDRSVGHLVGRRIVEAFPDAVDTPFQEEFERAFETQESVTFEAFYPPLDSWFEVRAYPSETGLSVYFRDVTDRVERERELEESRRRYRTLVEHFPNGAVALVDGDCHYVTVGGTPLEEIGATRRELEGHPGRNVLPDDVADLLAPRYEAALEGESSEFEHDVGGRSYQFRFQPVRDADGEVFAAMGMSQDVTARKQRERELELYETIVETVEDGIYALDDDARFVLVNEGFCELTGHDREALLGEPASTVYADELTPRVESMAAEMVAGDRDVASIELDIFTESGGSVPCESRFSHYPVGDGEGRCGVVRDVSERLERERELERRVHQQEVVTDLGQRALEARDLDTLVADAAAKVADTLDNDYCEVLDLDADADELLLRQGVGWDADVVGTATVSAVEDGSQAAYTLRSDRPVVVTDLEAEPRFDGPALLADHDVRSGITTVVGPPDDPWGVLGTHDPARKDFSARDVNFVRSVANTLASAIARHDHERELVRRGEQLAALNSLNDVVREITAAIVDQSTREEIEDTVCEHLADSASYRIAWIGDVDVATRTVRVRTEAGVEGYLDDDDVTVSVDPDHEYGNGPTGRAFRTGTIQTTRAGDSDPRNELWREHLAEYGFRSSAAIPIVHEDTVFGVLNLYTERHDGFEGQERVVVEKLGEVVGHAIAAAERKRALMSDEVVELEFHVPDVFAALGIDGSTPGTITLDQAVSLGDDEYLVYGSATADAVDSVRVLADVLPHWESVTFRDRAGGVGFEIRLSEPPVLSTIASVGGSAEAVIEDGHTRLTVQVPPSVEVRRIRDAVGDAFPAAQLLRRQQTTRDADSVPDARRALAEELTDRQRSILEAAYYGGYFEWPRAASAQDVSSAVGIAPSTFHQHLRNAERKVVGELLGGMGGSP